MLQDEIINLDELTELRDASIFEIQPKPVKSYEKSFDVQLDITIEMNLDQLVIARDGYTSLDLLSDVGGMESILISSCVILIGIWNYHFLDNALVTKLYRLNR